MNILKELKLFIKWRTAYHEDEFIHCLPFDLSTYPTDNYEKTEDELARFKIDNLTWAVRKKPTNKLI